MFAFNKYFAEAIGTYCLIFAGTGAMVINDLYGGAISHVGVALTWGMIVSVMIYSIGDLSGAHINPAVTISFWAAGQFKSQHVIPYLLFQFIGAILASLTLRVLFWEHPNLGSTLPSGTWYQSFVLEFILTTILMLVIFRVSSAGNEFKSMAGIAVGLTVGLEAMFAGPVCGASMNPARSFAPAVVSGNLQFLWVYLISTTSGALFAILLNRAITQPEQDEFKDAKSN